MSTQVSASVIVPDEPNLITLAAVPAANAVNNSVDVELVPTLMLAASQGTTIKVTSHGKDSEELISALGTLIKSKFGEDS